MTASDDESEEGDVLVARKLLDQVGDLYVMAERYTASPLAKLPDDDALKTEIKVYEHLVAQSAGDEFLFADQLVDDTHLKNVYLCLFDEDEEVKTLYDDITLLTDCTYSAVLTIRRALEQRHQHLQDVMHLLKLTYEYIPEEKDRKLVSENYLRSVDQLLKSVPKRDFFTEIVSFVQDQRKCWLEHEEAAVKRIEERAAASTIQPENKKKRKLTAESSASKNE